MTEYALEASVRSGEQRIEASNRLEALLYKQDVLLARATARLAAGVEALRVTRPRISMENRAVLLSQSPDQTRRADEPVQRSWARYVELPRSDAL